MSCGILKILLSQVNIWSISVEALAFPKRRHLTHEFLNRKGYAYVGTLNIDDFFVKVNENIAISLLHILIYQFRIPLVWFKAFKTKFL